MRLIMILTMMFSFAVTSYAGTKSHKAFSKTKSTKVAKHKESKKKPQHLAKKSDHKKKGMTASERKALAKKQVEKARREVAARKAKEKKLPEKIYPSIDDHADTKLVSHETSPSYEAPAAISSEDSTERDIASVEESTPDKIEMDDFQFIEDKQDNTETMDVSNAGDTFEE